MLPGRNELALAGLHTAAATTVKPPKIAESPVAFECRLLTSLSFNSNQAVLFGDVISVFVSDKYVLDSSRGIVDTPKLDLFGAMHAARWYCASTDRFEMARPTWAQWVAEGKTR